MSRFAADREVFYIEEPIPITSSKSYFHHEIDNSGVHVLVPHVAAGQNSAAILRMLLDEFLAESGLDCYLLWYYTPMALAWTRHLSPLAVVYDCMDELSGFKEAPQKMKEFERELFALADVVFTGGQSLFHSKKNQHSNLYLFPSSIDVPHFARARTVLSEPADQSAIPRIRIGYAGVIDERMDLDLIAAVADAKPEWHMVLLGPAVKISEDALPLRPNIHYLGMKPYDQLPDYIAGWDVAMLPFARNESTRFISPTKTPEYLAAGRPVISTSIRDVIDTYGELGVVHVADEPESFIEAVNRALNEDAISRLEKVDLLLSKSSWSRTWGRMSELIEDAIRKRAEELEPPHLATFSTGPRPSAALS